MPSYVIHSDSPISAREVTRPDLPGSPETGLPGVPDTGGPGGWPGFPERPGHGLPPQLPPRDEWPDLPPWFQPGVGLPIPPSPEFPMVPVDPEVTDPPEIWPPLPSRPELPDLSGKTLVLACFFISRHVKVFRWVVVDHEELKGKVEKAIEAVKGKLPAGGVGGRPPQRPGPS